MAVKLEKWYLDFYGMDVMAWGYCFGHPRLADGTFIHTSIIMEAGFDEKSGVFCMRTMSGNQYELELGCIDIQPEMIGKTGECLEKLNIPTGCLDGAEVLVKEKEGKELAEADGLTEDGDLFLQVAGNNVVKAFFKHGGRLYPLRVQCHVGMFQDSVLLIEHGIVDYRYFPEPFGMRTYHMSDTIKRLAVGNIGSCKACLDGKVYFPGTVEKVTVTGDYCQEGLFSPDMVNGKGLMRDLLDGLAKELGWEAEDV